MLIFNRSTFHIFNCGKTRLYISLFSTGHEFTGSCAGMCMEYSVDCWCDNACEGFGDCCMDKIDQCGAAPEDYDYYGSDYYGSEMNYFSGNYYQGRGNCFDFLFFTFFGGHMSFFAGRLVRFLWVSKPEWVLPYSLFSGGKCNVHSPRSTSCVTCADLLVRLLGKLLMVLVFIRKYSDYINELINIWVRWNQLLRLWNHLNNILDL